MTIAAFIAAFIAAIIAGIGGAICVILAIGIAAHVHFWRANARKDDKP